MYRNGRLDSTFRFIRRNTKFSPQLVDRDMSIPFKREFEEENVLLIMILRMMCNRRKWLKLDDEIK